MCRVIIPLQRGVLAMSTFLANDLLSSIEETGMMISKFKFRVANVLDAASNVLVNGLFAVCLKLAAMTKIAF
jgi:hypothetical protein